MSVRTPGRAALYVLNGRETVPMHRLGFLVITGTYTPHESEPQH
ncbi:hypothetical protein ACFVW1_31055 [Streptomyces olivochromogenes]